MDKRAGDRQVTPRCGRRVRKGIRRRTHNDRQMHRMKGAGEPVTRVAEVTGATAAADVTRQRRHSAQSPSGVGGGMRHFARETQREERHSH